MALEATLPLSVVNVPGDFLYGRFSGDPVWPLLGVPRGWGLGPGESSVLAWAHSHLGSEAIIDDLAARRCAAALRIPVRGTLGLTLIAKQCGHIASARQVLEQLRHGGMYLSDKVMNGALALVGE